MSQPLRVVTLTISPTPRAATFEVELEHGDGAKPSFTAAWPPSQASFSQLQLHHPPLLKEDSGENAELTWDDFERLFWKMASADTSSQYSQEQHQQAQRMMGQALYNFVFQGAVAEGWGGAKARRGSKDLILLRICPRPVVLRSLPWELLCEPGLGAFICQQEDICLVRMVNGPQGEPKGKTRGEIQALGVWASPRDSALGNIDPALEEQKITRAFQGAKGPRKVEIEWAQKVSSYALRNMSPEAAATTDILHVICHGEATPHGGRLILENEEGLPDHIEATSLSADLHHFDGLKLLYLNACWGASARLGPYASLGEALSRALNIPLVIANQRTLRSGDAALFAWEFYQRLFRISPEKAMTQARKELRSHTNNAGKDHHAWWTPVLFVRGEALPMFNESLSEVSSTPNLPKESPSMGQPKLRALQGELELTSELRAKLRDVMCDSLTNAQLTTVLQQSEVPPGELANEYAPATIRANTALNWLFRQAPEKLLPLLRAIKKERPDLDLP